MQTKIAIVSPIKYIENEINKIIVEEFNDIFVSIIPGIQDDIKKDLRPLFETSETFKEMTTALSNLNVEIGIPAPEATQRWLAIFDMLANQIEVRVNKMRVVGSGIDGGIICQMIKSDFEEIINSSFGQYVTEKGFNLPWQKWLLIDGDNIVISDHHVAFVNPLKPSKYFFSRTGGAIMVKRGSWQVPTEYSGTLEDNWITRVVQTYFDFIENFVYQSFKTRVQNAI